MKKPFTPYPAALNCALCALAFFRRRHQWKEAGTRRGLLRFHRIKDHSASNAARRAALRYIREARAAGWRGSIVAAVVSHERAERALSSP